MRTYRNSCVALTVMQGWFRAGLVIPDTSGTAFVSGRAPISWVGHWQYGPYHQAFPHDLAIVPLPKFGPHPSSCLGSWQWDITAYGCRVPERLPAHGRRCSRG